MGKNGDKVSPVTGRLGCQKVGRNWVLHLQAVDKANMRTRKVSIMKRKICKETCHGNLQTVKTDVAHTHRKESNNILRKSASV
jgi:hypothetical protein